MTEEEVKKALYELRLNYMLQGHKQKEETYDEYIKKLNILRHELAKLVLERREKEEKMK